MYQRGSTTPSSWGFDAEAMLDDDSDEECAEWFKIYLDSEKLREARINQRNPVDMPPTMQTVERW